MSTHRSVATILFTDIVGSTQRAAELGDRGWRDLLARHHALVRQALHRYHGHEIATAGDGFLAVFDAAEWAILCGQAIRTGVEDLGLEIRCGIHMGEVERTTGGDLGGIAVHVGARVAARADPGEILVTGGVRDAELGSGFGFEDRGRHALKGVPGEWRLWAVAEIPEGADAEVPAPRRDPSPGLWTRVKQSRMVQVGAIYLLASWILLQTADLFIDSFGLPAWAMPATVLLLLIGLVVILATAWVQSRPDTRARVAAGELPRAGAVDVAGLKDAVARGKLPHLTWGRAILGGAVAFALVFGLGGLFVVIQDRGANFSPDPALAEVAPGIAVLPFTVQGEGLDVMREGMVSLLSTGLDGAGGMRTIAPGTVYAQWEEQVPVNKTPELPTALAVARQTGAKYALIGSAVSIGSGIRVVADVYEVETGERLGQAQVEGSPDDVLPLVDRLGVEVLRVILQGEEELPEIDMAAVTTKSPEALRAYLEGEVHSRHFDIEDAIKAYTRAVEADSTFALAQARLGYAYQWVVGSFDLGWEHLDQAARLADRLPAREALLVQAALDEARRTTTSLEPLREAARKNPDDARVWYRLAETYTHVPSTRATAEEVERLFGRAVELDPRNAEYLFHYTEFPWWFSPDSARAAERLAMLERAAPNSAKARGGRLAFDLAFGDSISQRAAEARVGTEQVDALIQADTYLLYPRHQTSSLLVGREISERGGDRQGWGSAILANRYSLWWGRAGEGSEYFDSPEYPDHWQAEDVYRRFDWGLPTTEEALEATLGPGRIDTLANERVIVHAGAFAVDRGRWSDYERARTELKRRAERAFAENDSTAGMPLAGMATALEGYGLWKRGRPEAALPLLEDEQAQRVPQDRWFWLPRLYTELGRYQDAQRAYEAFQHLPFANLGPLNRRELGKVYEALGEYDKAVEAYEYFVEYWRGADPELQPMVEETRQAILRLRPLQRQ